MSIFWTKNEKKYKYPASVYWSAEDDAYLAFVPDLPGCGSHGATLEEAVNNLQEAIEMWIEAREKGGFPVPRPQDLLIQRLKSPLLNLSELARRAGLKQTTLESKIRRKTKFTEAQAASIQHVLGGL